MLTAMRPTRSLGTILVCLLLLQGCDAPPQPTGSLHRAVQSADLVQVKRHLYWGTDPNQPGPGGEPPLHIAVARGDVAIAKVLLKAGADPTLTGSDGRTALQVALTHGRVPAAELLLRNGAKDDPQALLHQLIAQVELDRDTLDLLLGRGAALDRTGPDGLTPLRLAIGTGSIDLTKRLLEQGAPLAPREPADGDAAAPPFDPAAIADPIMAQLLRRYGVID
jgi:uncharacterized protein